MSFDVMQVASQVWPYVLAGVLLLAALIIVILSSVVKKSVKPDAPSADPTPQTNGTAAQSEDPGHPFEESFGTAGQYLRAHSAGRDYRYEVPWFMVVGRAGSGKSSLLSAMGPGVDFEDAPAALQRATGLGWRLLDRAILLDVPGACMEFEGGVPGDERGWLRFLRLLERHRPRRPVDGVVLTIPATDLVGPESFNSHRLGEQATRFATRLAQAQRTLGFSFPVYVVITKCDAISGFGSFFRHVPERCREDIFGWSSPYQVDASFTPTWVDEAFDGVTEDLQRLQSEIFVERGDLEDAAGIFLFPDEFAALRDPLRIYLGHLFREIAYRESFRFRGLFFCGDAEEELAPVVAPQPVYAYDSPEQFETPPPPLPPSRARLRRVRQPILARRLLEAKIVPERGIARPLSRIFIARNRMVLAIQAVSVVLALVLSLGLWFSYRRLSHDRDSLTTMLNTMRRLPREVTTAAQQDDAGASGVQLLFAMAPSGNIRYRSVFMPASLFSETDDRITDVMTYAANRWVLGTLEWGLQQRARAILTQFDPQPPDADAQDAGTDDADADQSPVVDAAPPPLNIESTAEHQQLILFVNSLKELKDNADIYEKLRHGGIGNMEQVRTLVRYLYGSNLSEIQSSGHLAKALTAAQGNAFQLQTAQIDKVSGIMQSLLEDLFVRWFDESVLLADAENMRSKIGLLEQSRNVGYTQLNDALQSITQAKAQFDSPAFRWAGKQNFELTGPLARVVHEPIMIQKNPFLREEIRNYAIRSGQEHLTQLQENLVNLRTVMTGRLVEIKDKVVLSPGTENLQQGLQTALLLPFMARVNTRRIGEPPPYGTHLIWHVEPLQEALRQIDIYNRFLSEGLHNESASLVTPLKRVAMERMSQSVEDLIAQSPTSGNGAAGFADEITAIQDASEPLTQLAASLQKLGLVDTRNRMLRMVTTQGINVLTTLDDQLANARPYAARIDNWTGTNTAALAAFAATAPADLTEYLNHQREQIRYFQQQARPFVALLEKFLPNPPQVEARRIRKWKGIIQDFDEFEQKSPTGAITLLEQFIRGDMNKITPETSCKAPSAAPESGAYLDFFTQNQARLYGAVVRRCENLAAAVVLKTYGDIAELFNRTLAGKYPFTPSATGPEAGEATVEDVRAFYQLLDRDGNNAKSILLNNVSFGGSRQQAIRFLEQMQALRPVMVPQGAEVEKEPPLTLDVTPTLRVNRAHETGGNQVIEWMLQIGGTIFRQNEPPHIARWRPGNPIRLSLRWAKDSTFMPQGDARQPNLRALDRLVYFEFTNRWSLLTALKRQEPSPTEMAGAADLGPSLLRLRIPTVQDPRWAAAGTTPPPSSSVLFLHLSLNLAGTKTKASLPGFPSRAPQLVAGEIKE